MAECRHREHRLCAPSASSRQAPSQTQDVLLGKLLKLFKPQCSICKTRIITRLRDEEMRSSTYNTCSAWHMVCTHGCSVASDSLRPHGLQPTRLLCPWDSPGRTTGVGCHALLLGIFPSQGLNLCFLQLQHCRQILLLLSHWGSPKQLHGEPPKEKIQ